MGKRICRIVGALGAAALAASLFGCGSAGVTGPAGGALPSQNAALQSQNVALQQQAAGIAPESGPVPSPAQTVMVAGRQVAADQALVKFQAGATTSQIQALLHSYGSQPIYFIRWMNFYLVSVPSGTDIVSFIQTLNGNPLVDHAQYNEILHAVQVS